AALIHRLDLRWANGAGAGCKGIHCAAESLDRTAGAGACIFAGISDDAIAKVGTGHVANDLSIFGESLSFICAKEKETILLDRSPECAAKRVANDFARGIGFAVV